MIRHVEHVLFVNHTANLLPFFWLIRPAKTCPVLYLALFEWDNIKILTQAHDVNESFVFYRLILRARHVDEAVVLARGVENT